MGFSRTSKTDVLDQKSLDYKARWNNLRTIGNSGIARASLAVPVLGYLILFNSDLVDYLRIHTSFCHNCSVSWRLNFFYFGCCFFALGSLVYGIYCPPLIKKYAGATDFFERERDYFCNPENLNYLFKLIKRDKGKDADDPHGLRFRVNEMEVLRTENLPHLAGLMGEHYVLQNRRDKAIRELVYMSYVAGFILLAIPTLITFVLVLGRAIEPLLPNFVH
jgi:hypothetical protein